MWKIDYWSVIPDSAFTPLVSMMTEVSIDSDIIYQMIYIEALMDRLNEFKTWYASYKVRFNEPWWPIMPFSYDGIMDALNSLLNVTTISPESKEIIAATDMLMRIREYFNNADIYPDMC